MSGKRISVQGVGAVGYHLVRHLVESGGQVIVADIRKDNLKRVTSDFNGIEVVPPDEIYDVDVDVFAPCAMGAVVNDDTLPD